MKITNKKLFQKQILTILISIAIMILIAIFSNYLKVEGFSSFFTTPGLKEAYKITPFDIRFINFITVVSYCAAIFFCGEQLSYNADIAQIEKEEKIFMKGVRENANT